MAVAPGVGILLGLSPQARSLHGSTLKLGARLAEEAFNRRSRVLRIRARVASGATIACCQIRKPRTMPGPSDVAW